MGAIHEIADPSDPRVADYRSVRDRDARGVDGRAGLFVGETRLVVEAMLERPGRLVSAFVETRHAAGIRSLMDARGAADAPLYTADAAILATIAGFNVHRGILAIGLRPSAGEMALDAAIPRRPRLTLLLLDGINNIDNVGMLYRCAAAFGVDAVVLSPTTHDHLYRKSLRVSIGHALRIPTARSADWAGDLGRLRAEWGVSLVGTAISASVPLDETTQPERVGVLVGQEFSGLSEESVSLCDTLVRIPMAAGVDSLNVAVAAAICLHRLSRGERI